MLYIIHLAYGIVFVMSCGNTLVLPGGKGLRLCWFAGAGCSEGSGGDCRLPFECVVMLVTLSVASSGNTLYKSDGCTHVGDATFRLQCSHLFSNTDASVRN